MDTWAKATPEDREALFNQTAVTKGISPEIVEKDFWVCWTLHQIFQFRDFPRLIFKGGARYELAKKGTLRLVPGPQLEEALRRDYEKMREMYFGQEPDFDAVMTDIRELERAFNERE